MDVDIFIPCTIDQFYPELGMNLVKILEKVGVVVHYNEQQTCCGQTAFNAGHWDDAHELGEKFIREFTNDRELVAPSAACLHMVKNHYAKLFHNTSLHIEHRKLSDKSYELSDFLVNRLKIKHLGATFAHKVWLHESCTASRKYPLNDEIQTLLRNVKGLELVNSTFTDEPCGCGSSFSIVHEPVSVALAEQLVQRATEAGAEYILVTEATCLLQIHSYIQKNKLDIKAIHLVDVLASGWEF